MSENESERKSDSEQAKVFKSENKQTQKILNGKILIGKY